MRSSLPRPFRGPIRDRANKGQVQNGGTMRTLATIVRMRTPRIKGIRPKGDLLVGDSETG